MIRVNKDIALTNHVVEERFVRAFGSRGQNANKDATAVELRFDVGRSSLAPDAKERLIAMAGRHVTSKGVLVLVSSADSSQAKNRAAAHARLALLIRRAAQAPKERRSMVPARATRLTSKKRRSAIKDLRRHPPAI